MFSIMKFMAVSFFTDIFNHWQKEKKGKRRWGERAAQITEICREYQKTGITLKKSLLFVYDLLSSKCREGSLNHTFGLQSCHHLNANPGLRECVESKGVCKPCLCQGIH